MAITENTAVTDIRKIKSRFGKSSMMFRFFLTAACFFASVTFASSALSSPLIKTERSRNLRQLENSELLWQYHTQTTSEGRFFYTFPERDTAFNRKLQKEGNKSLFFLNDTLGEGHSYAIAVSPVLGIDYRGSSTLVKRNDPSLGDTVQPGVDGGLFIRGFADSVDFALDARMYVENHTADKAASYDGEVFDEQNKETNADANYISYSRYRAHIALNYSWARLQLARDVLHFGPGYYNNLSLNQFALPYNMLSLDMVFGPLRVFSAYADLRVDSWSYSLKNLNDRNLYAHRYELAFEYLTIGMSELQVLYNENKPWLFTPVVPLFIEKGNYSEEVNNGALAFDMNIRIANIARIYAEFFLDDMESPNALWENKYSNNRWAGMLGMQAGHDFNVGEHKLELGTIAEIARVEPYTYCHFDTAKAQLAHLGRPIGNPNGPNSLVVDWTIYSRFAINAFSNVFASLHNKWKWKGIDKGSRIEDQYETVEKHFIHDAPLIYTISPAIAYEGKRISLMGEFTFGDEKAILLRTCLMW